jgi:hypothetical protein
VKDFFRDNWKIAAACALGAFLLSLVIGLIARNLFGVAFLRAFLLAVLFAGLGVGARLVARTYLPELVAASNGTQPEPDGSRGKNIDIVLPEENPRRRTRTGSRPAGDTARNTEPGDLLPDEEEAEEAAAVAAALDDDSLARAEARALGELTDELAEELPSASEPTTGGTEDFAELGEPVESGPEKKSAKGGQPVEGQADELDALPDISNLEMAPEEPSGKDGGRGHRGAAYGEKPQDAIRGAVSGQDPATIARAIRTVLKKDEKG